MTRIIIGVLLSELLLYLLGAFLFANLGWLDNMFSWHVLGRYFLMVCVAAFGVLGCMIAGFCVKG